VCKNLLKIPNRLGKMSENHRVDFFDSHCRRRSVVILCLSAGWPVLFTVRPSVCLSVRLSVPSPCVRAVTITSASHQLREIYLVSTNYRFSSHFHIAENLLLKLGRQWSMSIHNALICTQLNMRGLKYFYAIEHRHSPNSAELASSHHNGRLVMNLMSVIQWKRY